MRIFSIAQFQVQIEKALAHEGFQEMFQKPRIEGFDFCLRALDAIHQIRPPAQIHGAKSQGLVHRDIGMPVARDSFALAQGLMQCLAESSLALFERGLSGNMCLHSDTLRYILRTYTNVCS